MEYKHLRFPLKMMLGYLLGILILTLLFSASIAHLSTVINDYDNTVRNAWRQLYALQSLQATVLQIRLDVEDNISRIEMDLKLIDYWFSSFLESSKISVPQDIVRLATEFNAFRQQTLKLIDLKEKKVPPAGLAAEYRNFIKDYNIFIGRINVEITKSKSGLDVAEVSFLQRINQLLLINIILAPLSFLFLYIYGYFLSNYTGLRLKKFLESLHKILSGNYRHKIDDASQDEIGQIAQGINELANRLKNK